MAFHESFWVVTGTAAPVIALAVIVSAGDAFRQVLTTDAERRHAQRNVHPDRAKLSQQDDEDLLKSHRKMLRFVQAVATFNLLLQAALLAVSLVCLADGANLVPPWLAIAAGVGGIMLLSSTAYAAVGAHVARNLWLR